MQITLRGITGWLQSVVVYETFESDTYKTKTFRVVIKNQSSKVTCEFGYVTSKELHDAISSCT